MMTQQNMEETKAKVISALATDPFLRGFWSGGPECNIFPYQKSDYFKELLVTVFLKESVINRETVGAVVHRIAELTRPHIQLVPELRALIGWIGGGDSSDKYFRILNFGVKREALESPALQSLAQHFDDEYYNEEGISFLRYHPL